MGADRARGYQRGFGAPEVGAFAAVAAFSRVFAVECCLSLFALAFGDLSPIDHHPVPPKTKTVPVPRRYHEVWSGNSLIHLDGLIDIVECGEGAGIEDRETAAVPP